MEGRVLDDLAAALDEGQVQGVVAAPQLPTGVLLGTLRGVVPAK